MEETHMRVHEYNKFQQAIIKDIFQQLEIYSGYLAGKHHFTGKLNTYEVRESVDTMLTDLRLKLDTYSSSDL
tara:strand:+ start:262 stop:477 length:216 start_codon:yes stop_codon:yes gene_type:complete